MKYDIINYINAGQVVKQNQSWRNQNTRSRYLLLNLDHQKEYTHTYVILHILYMNTLFNVIKESIEMHAFVFKHSYLLD